MMKMPTKEQVEAAKREQLAEANNRDGVVDAEHRALNDRALEVTGDETNVEPQPTEARDPETGRQATATRGDQRRAAIAKGYRETRPAADDLVFQADPTMPPELRSPPTATEGETEHTEDGAGEGETDQSGEQPPTRTYVVRGKDVIVSQEEADRLVMRGLAADDYMDQAKEELRKAQELRRSIESGTSRAGSDGTRAPGQDDAHAETGDDKTDERPDPYELIVDKIAYGDTKGAAADLRTLTETVVDERSKRNAVNTVEQDKAARDIATCQAVLSVFKKEHPDLASDPRAVKAMEASYADEFKKDLAEIGVTPEVMEQRLGRPPTDDDFASYHHWYRANGGKVRSFADCTNASYDAYQKWKGGDTTKPTPGRKQNVVVTLDKDGRAARRAVIPQQPQRQGPAGQPAQDEQPTKRDASDVIAGMRGRNKGTDRRREFVKAS